ncbi:hypothetical protein Ddc_24849 [Ditylenchus destructor]|nr:hypothetical protein Ddc_24849 [Ditylenchus destructor]
MPSRPHWSRCWPGTAAPPPRRRGLASAPRPTRAPPRSRPAPARRPAAGAARAGHTVQAATMNTGLQIIQRDGDAWIGVADPHRDAGRYAGRRSRLRRCARVGRGHSDNSAGVDQPPAPHHIARGIEDEAVDRRRVRRPGVEDDAVTVRSIIMADATAAQQPGFGAVFAGQGPSQEADDAILSIDHEVVVPAIDLPDQDTAPAAHRELRERGLGHQVADSEAEGRHRIAWPKQPQRCAGRRVIGRPAIGNRRCRMHDHGALSFLLRPGRQPAGGRVVPRDW